MPGLRYPGPAGTRGSSRASLPFLTFFQRVGFVEQGRLDDGIVHPLRLDAAITDASTVRAVGEHNRDSLTRPLIAFAGEDAAGMEERHHLARAAVTQILAKDHADHFRFAIIDRQRLLAFSAAAIPVGRGAGPVSPLLHRTQLSSLYLGAVGQLSGLLTRLPGSPFGVGSRIDSCFSRHASLCLFTNPEEPEAQRNGNG